MQAEERARQKINDAVSAAQQRPVNAYEAQLGTQQFAQDREVLDKLQSSLFKERMHTGNFELGGFSRFARMRDELDATLSPDTLQAMMQQTEEGSAARNEVIKRQLQRERIAAQIQQQELLAVERDPLDAQRKTRDLAYGLKDSQGMSAMQSILKDRDNVVATAEELKRNEDYYQIDADGQGRWINAEAGRVYQSAQKSIADLDQYISSVLPTIMQRDFSQDQSQFAALSAAVSGREDPSQKISAYYENLSQSIAAYIQQQDKTIEDLTQELEKNDGDKYAKGSVARQALENRIAQARAQKDKAEKELTPEAMLQGAITSSDKQMTDLTRELQGFRESGYDKASRRYDQMEQEIRARAISLRDKSGYYDASNGTWSDSDQAQAFRANWEQSFGTLKQQFADMRAAGMASVMEQEEKEYERFRRSSAAGRSISSVDQLDQWYRGKYDAD